MVLFRKIRYRFILLTITAESMSIIRCIYISCPVRLSTCIGWSLVKLMLVVMLAIIIMTDLIIYKVKEIQVKVCNT